MSKNSNFVNEKEKLEIAKELGVYDKVVTNGWKDVSSKDCGNIVKKALERQEKKELKL
jgi:small acid-soluble spore protein F (minor alpha/beta-type SASP)